MQTCHMPRSQVMKLWAHTILSITLAFALSACSDDGTTEADQGVTKKDGPVTQKDGPAVKKDGPAVKKDGPTVKKDGPAVKKDGPAVKKDGPAVKKDGPVVKKDGAPVKKDKGVVLPPDQGQPKPDMPPAFSCPPQGLKALSYKGSAAGAWTVGLEPKTSYKAATLTGGTAKHAAAAADFNQSWQQVAGFVLSKPSAATAAATESAAAISAISKNIYGKVTNTAKGAGGKSHDGFDMVASTTFTITTASTSDVSTVRNKVVEALINNTNITISGLPSIFGVPDTSFVLRFSTVLRKDGRVIHIGAVTDAKGDADLSKVTGIVSRDLAGATGLAVAGKTAAASCDKIAVGKGSNKVDFIWVMDESGSMNAERANIASNSNLIWTEAKKAGLDFRMAVTNVVNPTGSYKNCVGRFCTTISTNPQDTKGTDRFLLPTEQAIFAACIKNPPCYEGGAEYGLVNAKAAVSLHLPRAANQPTKIRTGAQVVIIVATDETPNSLNKHLGGQFNTCTLSTKAQSAVDAALKTDYIGYFNGATSKDAKIDYFHVFGGVCKNKCSAQVAHGYKEVAAKFKGTVFDVCQASYTTALKKMIQDIVLSGTPLKLTHKPIVASVLASVNGTKLNRSKLNGFDYSAAANSIVIYGSATPKVGTNVVISYQRWK